VIYSRDFIDTILSSSCCMRA